MVAVDESAESGVVVTPEKGEAPRHGVVNGTPRDYRNDHRRSQKTAKVAASLEEVETTQGQRWQEGDPPRVPATQ